MNNKIVNSIKLMLFSILITAGFIIFANGVGAGIINNINSSSIYMTDSIAESPEETSFVRNIEKIYAAIQSDSYKIPFTHEQIATRLYYLSILTGETVGDGEIDFSINANMTRLEALVITIRLMGKEDEAHRLNYTHRFSDVPQWGSAYVGYACYVQLPGFTEAEISKMRSVQISSGNYLTDELYFNPDDPVTSSMFIDYLQYVLGYGKNSNISNELSVLKYVKKNKITRGEGFELVFRALRSKINKRDITLSESFVENGVISYEDAIFLIWTDDSKETDLYIKNSGYSPEETIANGYYTIVNENGKYLNVNSNGANSDFEGVGVTLFKGTGDITQLFRVERTERGTYLIYSAASRGGFSRLLGLNTKSYSTVTGLYNPTSTFAKEFFIKSSLDDSGNKKWYLIPYENSVSAECNVLTADKNSSALTLKTLQQSSGFSQLWSFEKSDVLVDDGVEFALFPASYLHITQPPFGEYSHMEQNAIDCVSVGRFFAPFTAVIKKVDTESAGKSNIVIIESKAEVRFADGSKDYMTVVLLHDNDISDLSAGQILNQGQAFYDMGSAGNATGDHVHISVYRGKYNPLTCSIAMGGINPQDAFFILPDTRVQNTGGLQWICK